MSYGLVARGPDVDLKDFPLVWAYLNNLSFEEVSEILHSQLSLHVSKVFFLIMSVFGKLLRDLGWVFLPLLTRG